MAAYIIVNVNVHEPIAYEEYKRLTLPSIEAYQGQFVVRGGAIEVLEGEPKPGRIVVVTFPDTSLAKSWWNSPEYAVAKAIRQRTATTEMILVEGV